MFFEYFAQTADEMVSSIKSFFGLIKLIFFAFYLGFCLIVGVSTTDLAVKIVALISVGLELVVYLSTVLLSKMAKKKGFDYKKSYITTMGVLSIARIIVRLFSAMMLFVSCVHMVQNSNSAFWIIALMFSCTLTLFIYAKEIIYTLYKFFKYKATRAINRFYDQVSREVLENSSTDRFFENIDR